MGQRLVCGKSQTIILPYQNRERKPDEQQRETNLRAVPPIKAHLFQSQRMLTQNPR